MSNFKYLSFLLFLLFFSCINSYESAIVGEYHVSDFERLDGMNPNQVEACKLYLNSNREFEIKFGDKRIKGNWIAGDDGDRTWIEFKTNKFSYQGIVLGENYSIVKILNPQNLVSYDIISLSFERNKNTD